MSELALNFDYNANQLQWLLLAPGLINWVTQDTHLGLYRNYFGQDIDDIFIADNEWSSAVPVHPGGDRPARLHLPAAEQGLQPGRHAARRPDEPADVAYVANWEQQTGIKLNLAFNGGRRVHGDTAADAVERQLHRRRHRQRDDLHRSRPGRRLTAIQRGRRSSTRCWPTRPTSTGSPTPGRTCSWAARCGSRRPSPGHGQRLWREPERRHLQL